MYYLNRKRQVFKQVNLKQVGMWRSFETNLTSMMPHTHTHNTLH